jgi:uncharacterized protein (DUF2225 family)
MKKFIIKNIDNNDYVSGKIYHSAVVEDEYGNDKLFETKEDAEVYLDSMLEKIFKTKENEKDHLNSMLETRKKFKIIEINGPEDDK